MASPTNKITEDHIRKLVSESKNRLNPLSMEFTYEYATKLVSLNWTDMKFAIENNFLAHQSAIEHALVELQKNESTTEEILELACILQSDVEFPYNVCRLVNKLAILHNTDNSIDSKEKFLYVSLSWVYEHKDDYCNPIEVVDILCDEIDYPVEVKQLCSFMPSSDFTIEGMFDRLTLYLENQRGRWI